MYELIHYSIFYTDTCSGLHHISFCVHTQHYNPCSEHRHDTGPSISIFTFWLCVFSHTRFCAYNNNWSRSFNEDTGGCRLDHLSLNCCALLSSICCCTNVPVHSNTLQENTHPYNFLVPIFIDSKLWSNFWYYICSHDRNSINITGCWSQHGLHCWISISYHSFGCVRLPVVSRIGIISKFNFLAKHPNTHHCYIGKFWRSDACSLIYPHSIVSYHIKAVKVY